MIAIENASQVFRARDGSEIVALENITLNVPQGEFVTIAGPSGCGKSTLLRLVAGLIRPTFGRISVGGRLVTEPRLDTGFVFQAPTLLPWATILQNVLFPLRLTGDVTARAVSRARELLALVGLEDFGARYPQELSGGMQQRVAICRALIRDPDVLLMDEPFGALDALTREEMSLELLRIWTARPKTILFVTHSIPEAVLLADRVVVMSARPGRIAEIIDVPLQRPRSFDVEKLDAFQTCTQRIRRLIFGHRRESAVAA
jgi:NitT/TauT family transport system ATP-binding protein